MKEEEEDGGGGGEWRMEDGRGWRRGAVLTPELLECLSAWPIVPCSAVFPSIITACYPS